MQENFFNQKKLIPANVVKAIGKNELIENLPVEQGGATNPKIYGYSSKAISGNLKKLVIKAPLILKIFEDSFRALSITSSDLLANLGIFLSVLRDEKGNRLEKKGYELEEKITAYLNNKAGVLNAVKKELNEECALLFQSYYALIEPERNNIELAKLEKIFSPLICEGIMVEFVSGALVRAIGENSRSMHVKNPKIKMGEIQGIENQFKFRTLSRYLEGTRDLQQRINEICEKLNKMGLDEKYNHQDRVNLFIQTSENLSHELYPLFKEIVDNIRFDNFFWVLTMWAILGQAFDDRRFENILSSEQHGMAIIDTGNFLSNQISSPDQLTAENLLRSMNGGNEFFERQIQEKSAENILPAENADESCDEESNDDSTQTMIEKSGSEQSSETENEIENIVLPYRFLLACLKYSGSLGKADDEIRQAMREFADFDMERFFDILEDRLRNELQDDYNQFEAGFLLCKKWIESSLEQIKQHPWLQGSSVFVRK